MDKDSSFYNSFSFLRIYAAYREKKRHSDLAELMDVSRERSLRGETKEEHIKKSKMYDKLKKEA